MQLLAIDQGNTRTKFGLFSNGELQRVWAVATNKTATVDELRTAAFHLPDVPSTVQLGLCSVVPELLSQWQRLAEECTCPLTSFTGLSPTPLTNAYETPETLGADRLLAAVAAALRVGVPVITLALGTASVVDAVSAEHAYLGGMIAPGIGSASDALAQAASALWPAQWHEPVRAIGRSSVEAMSNGLFFHSIGGLQKMVQAIRTELANHAPLVLTGGWAQRVAPHLDDVALVDEYLVLHGIALTIAQ